MERSMESRPRMLLDVVRETIRLKHYSCRTEVSYIVSVPGNFKEDLGILGQESR